MFPVDFDEFYRQQPQFFPGFPGPPGGGQLNRLERQINRLEREVDRLQMQVNRMEQRLSRVERRLGF